MYNAHPYIYINILVKKVCIIVELLYGICMLETCLPVTWKMLQSLALATHVSILHHVYLS